MRRQKSVRHEFLAEVIQKSCEGLWDITDQCEGIEPIPYVGIFVHIFAFMLPLTAARALVEWVLVRTSALPRNRCT